jgi:hypothetical protein
MPSKRLKWTKADRRDFYRHAFRANAGWLDEITPARYDPAEVPKQQDRKPQPPRLSPREPDPEQPESDPRDTRVRMWCLLILGTTAALVVLAVLI